MIKIYNRIALFCFFLAGIFGIFYWVLPVWALYRTRIVLAQDLEKKINIADEYLKKTVQSLSTISQHEATIALCLKNNMMLQDHTDYAIVLKKIMKTPSLINNLSVVSVNGDVVFSQNEKTLIGQKITQGFYKKKLLGRHFDQMSIVQNAYTTLVQSDKGVDIILMTFLVREEKRIIGFVFIEYSPEELFHEISNNLTYLNAELLLGKASLDILRVVPLSKNQANEVSKLRPFHEYLLKASNGDSNQAIIQGVGLKPMFASWRYSLSLNAGIAIYFPIHL